MVNSELPPQFGLWPPILIMQWLLWWLAFPRNLFLSILTVILILTNISKQILLNNFELSFLEFKHIYKIQRPSLFSFCLFIFYSLCKNTLLKIFVIFTGKHLCEILRNLYGYFSNDFTKWLFETLFLNCI